MIQGPFEGIAGFSKAFQMRLRGFQKIFIGVLGDLSLRGVLEGSSRYRGFQRIYRVGCYSSFQKGALGMFEMYQKSIKSFSVRFRSFQGRFREFKKVSKDLKGFSLS